jgi:hypothetical protein
MADVVISSGYGVRSRRPFVMVSVNEESMQLTPLEALRFAEQIITAAMASVADAAMVDTLGGESITTEEIGPMLLKFREARKKIDTREEMP